MTRRALHWLPVVAMITLLVAAVPAPRVQAGDVPPVEVNGLFYGDGDDARYEVYSYSPPIPPSTRNRGTLYFRDEFDGDGERWLYFAMVLDRSVNDNVFAIRQGNTADRDYLDSSGWGNNGHTFDQLYKSDCLTMTLRCGDDTTYTWTQGYIYDGDGDQDPLEGDWLSDVGDPNQGGGTPPPSLHSASSLQWNMINTLWDVTLGGNRVYDDWKSPASGSPPVYPGDTGYPDFGAYAADSDVTDEIGYPPIGSDPDNITYDTEWQWEWPLVYEFAFKQSDCGGSGITNIEVISAHNSPSKDASEDVPVSVELLWFEAKKQEKTAITLSWATGNEIDSLGFDLWRAEAIDGERVKINEELIPSKVPLAGGGAVYEYTDRPMRRASTYFYWLEDVDVYGTTRVHGPVETSLIKRLRFWDVLRGLEAVKPPVE